jgi:hypothetical protein
MTEVLSPIADANICTLSANVCGGKLGTRQTLHMYGTLPADTCVVLLTYQPSLPGFAATEAGIAKLELELERVASHAECAGNCAAAPGGLLVRPLRVDWNEANVDWCVFDGTNPWNGSGASSIGVDTFDVVAAPTINATDASITFSLDTPGFMPALASGRIAMRVESQRSAIFVAAAREQGSASAPKLRIQICR